MANWTEIYKWAEDRHLEMLQKRAAHCKSQKEQQPIAGRLPFSDFQTLNKVFSLFHFLFSGAFGLTWTAGNSL